MILFLAVALAAGSVPLCGGSLRRLAGLRLRRVWTVVAALAVQVLVISVLPTALPHGLAAGLHLCSYALVAVFVWANRAVPWLWLVGLGGLANLVAIGANGGVMPASRAALAAAGRSTAHGFANSAWRPHEHLRWLGDEFSFPRTWPLANVFSPGDVCLVAGTVLLLHSVGASRVGRRRRSQPSRSRMRATAPAGIATQVGR